MKNHFSRRTFFKQSLITGLGLMAIGPVSAKNNKAGKQIGKMKFGLVTYQWGKDWDLPTLIKNCEIAGYKGVELRTEHAHGVETKLSSAERADVRKRFADSSVTCLGYGSNFEYHSPDRAELRKNLDLTKEYIKLCSDIGATGIKVKPNTLPKEIAREKTIAQIASALNEIGKYAQDFNQLVRVEVHGPITQEIPNMKAIFDQVTEKNVKMCWNCNDADLMSPGLEANFNSVRKWIGDTVHVHELNSGNYPYPELFRYFTEMKYKGWILLEASSNPSDRIAAMQEQLALFKQMKKAAKKKA